MRIIPVALFVILFLIIGIPVLGIEWLIGKISKKTMDYSSLRIVQWAFKVIVRLAGFKLPDRFDELCRRFLVGYLLRYNPAPA